MKRRGLGRLILAIWLILYGIQPLLKFSIPYNHVVMPVLAIIAGLLILLDQ